MPSGPIPNKQISPEDGKLPLATWAPHFMWNVETWAVFKTLGHVTMVGS